MSLRLFRHISPFRVVMAGLIVGAAVLIGSVAVAPKQASADTCRNLNGYIDCHRGFFFGGTSNGVIDLMPGTPHAIPAYVNTAAEFTTFIRNQLGCNRPVPGGIIPQNPIGRNSIGAAFIILTMMDVRPPVHPNRACAEYPTWEKRVFEWERAGDIEWNVPTAYEFNTAYAPNIMDAVFLNENNAGTTDAIKFYSPTDPDRTPYSIRRACANPIGGLGRGFGVLNTPPSGRLQPVSCVSGPRVFGTVSDPDIAPGSAGNPSIPVDVWFYSPGWNNSQPVMKRAYAYPRTTGAAIGEITGGRWVAGVAKPGPDATGRTLDQAFDRVEVKAYVQDIPLGTNPNILLAGTSNYGPCVRPTGACQSATMTAVSTDPTQLPSPTSTFKLTAQLSFSNTASPTSVNNVDTTRLLVDYFNRTPGDQQYIRLVSPTGAVRNEAVATTRWNNGTNTIVMETGTLPAVGNTGTYRVYWGVNAGSYGAINCPVTIPGNPGGQPFDITYKPYTTIRGGDVSAGAGMSNPAAPGTCTNANDKAGIVSWNQGEGFGYAGAGTNYGALALGSIQDVATGQTSPYAPDGVAFANARANGTTAWTGGNNDIYGGGLGSIGCMPDLFVEGAVTATRPEGSAYEVNREIGGSLNSVLNITQANQQPTYYIDGDAYITSNIIFANSGAYASAGTVPRFTLVVRGNIYISKDVTRIDGVLAAYPRTDRGSRLTGAVYTCAPNGINTTGILTRQLRNGCNTQLTVNGAVIAKQLWLLRTAGDYATNVPAERFNFTPEVWLGEPFTGDPSGKASNYNSISSLPPVL